MIADVIPTQSSYDYLMNMDYPEDLANIEDDDMPKRNQIQAAWKNIINHKEILAVIRATSKSQFYVWDGKDEDDRLLSDDEIHALALSWRTRNLCHYWRIIWRIRKQFSGSLKNPFQAAFLLKYAPKIHLLKVKSW